MSEIEYRLLCYADRTHAQLPATLSRAVEVMPLINAIQRDIQRSSDPSSSIHAVLAPWREAARGRQLSVASHARTARAVSARLLNESESTDDLRLWLALLLLDRVRVEFPSLAMKLPGGTVATWLQAADRSFFAVDSRGTGFVGIDVSILLAALGLMVDVASAVPGVARIAVLSLSRGGGGILAAAAAAHAQLLSAASATAAGDAPQTPRITAGEAAALAGVGAVTLSTWRCWLCREAGVVGPNGRSTVTGQARQRPLLPPRPPPTVDALSAFAAALEGLLDVRRADDGAADEDDNVITHDGVDEPDVFNFNSSGEPGLTSHLSPSETPTRRRSGREAAAAAAAMVASGGPLKLQSPSRHPQLTLGLIARRLAGAWARSAHGAVAALVLQHDPSASPAPDAGGAAARHLAGGLLLACLTSLGAGSGVLAAAAAEGEGVVEESVGADGGMDDEEGWIAVAANDVARRIVASLPVAVGAMSPGPHADAAMVAAARIAAAKAPLVARAAVRHHRRVVAACAAAAVRAATEQVAAASLRAMVSVLRPDAAATATPSSTAPVAASSQRTSPSSRVSPHVQQRGRDDAGAAAASIAAIPEPVVSAQQPRSPEVRAAARDRGYSDAGVSDALREQRRLRTATVVDVDAVAPPPKLQSPARHNRLRAPHSDTTVGTVHDAASPPLPRAEALAPAPTASVPVDVAAGGTGGGGVGTVGSSPPGRHRRQSPQRQTVDVVRASTTATASTTPAAAVDVRSPSTPGQPRARSPPAQSPPSRTATQETPSSPAAAVRGSDPPQASPTSPPRPRASPPSSGRTRRGPANNPLMAVGQGATRAPPTRLALERRAHELRVRLEQTLEALQQQQAEEGERGDDNGDEEDGNASSVDEHVMHQPTTDGAAAGAKAGDEVPSGSDASGSVGGRVSLPVADAMTRDARTTGYGLGLSQRYSNPDEWVAATTSPAIRRARAAVLSARGRAPLHSHARLSGTGASAAPAKRPDAPLPRAALAASKLKSPWHRPAALVPVHADGPRSVGLPAAVKPTAAVGPDAVSLPQKSAAAAVAAAAVSSAPSSREPLVVAPSGEPMVPAAAFGDALEELRQRLRDMELELAELRRPKASAVVSRGPGRGSFSQPAAAGAARTDDSSSGRDSPPPLRAAPRLQGGARADAASNNIVTKLSQRSSAAAPAVPTVALFLDAASPFNSPVQPHAEDRGRGPALGEVEQEEHAAAERASAIAATVADAVVTEVRRQLQHRHSKAALQLQAELQLAHDSQKPPAAHTASTNSDASVNRVAQRPRSARSRGRVGSGSITLQQYPPAEGPQAPHSAQPLPPPPRRRPLARASDFNLAAPTAADVDAERRRQAPQRERRGSSHARSTGAGGHVGVAAARDANTKSDVRAPILRRTSRAGSSVVSSRDVPASARAAVASTAPSSARAAFAAVPVPRRPSTSATLRRPSKPGVEGPVATARRSSNAAAEDGPTELVKQAPSTRRRLQRTPVTTSARGNGGGQASRPMTLHDAASSAERLQTPAPLLNAVSSRRRRSASTSSANVSSIAAQALLTRTDGTALQHHSGATPLPALHKLNLPQLRHGATPTPGDDALTRAADAAVARLWQGNQRRVSANGDAHVVGVVGRIETAAASTQTHCSTADRESSRSKSQVRVFEVVDGEWDGASGGADASDDEDAGLRGQLSPQKTLRGQLSPHQPPWSPDVGIRGQLQPATPTTEPRGQLQLLTPEAVPRGPAGTLRPRQPVRPPPPLPHSRPYPVNEFPSSGADHRISPSSAAPLPLLGDPPRTAPPSPPPAAALPPRRVAPQPPVDSSSPVLTAQNSPNGVDAHAPVAAEPFERQQSLSVGFQPQTASEAISTPRRADGRFNFSITPMSRARSTTGTALDTDSSVRSKDAAAPVHDERADVVTSAVSDAPAAVVAPADRASDPPTSQGQGGREAAVPLQGAPQRAQDVAPVSNVPESPQRMVSLPPSPTSTPSLPSSESHIGDSHNATGPGGDLTPRSSSVSRESPRSPSIEQGQRPQTFIVSAGSPVEHGGGGDVETPRRNSAVDAEGATVGPHGADDGDIVPAPSTLGDGVSDAHASVHGDVGEIVTDDEMDASVHADDDTARVYMGPSNDEDSDDDDNDPGSRYAGHDVDAGEVGDIDDDNADTRRHDATDGSTDAAPHEDVVQPEPLLSDPAYKFALSLLTGRAVRKHGRQGWPHDRILWVDATTVELLLRWAAPADRPGTPRCRSAADALATGDAVRLGEIVELRTGISTEVMRRSGTLRNAGRYVSLVLSADSARNHRGRSTLDFECPSEAEADELAHGYKWLIIDDVTRLQRAMLVLYDSGLWAPQQELVKR